MSAVAALHAIHAHGLSAFQRLSDFGKAIVRDAARRARRGGPLVVIVAAARDDDAQRLNQTDDCEPATHACLQEGSNDSKFQTCKWSVRTDILSALHFFTYICPHRSVAFGAVAR